jgi:hypothetical protein
MKAFYGGKLNNIFKTKNFCVNFLLFGCIQRIFNKKGCQMAAFQFIQLNIHWYDFNFTQPK